jgi:hypothetical protein
MLELIDRQATLKKMCETCGYCEMFENAMRSTHPYFVTKKCNNYKFLAEQPTIEAEPVRHGRWIDVPDANTKVAKCSLCGFWQRTNGDDKTGKHLIHTAVYRYCAGCGARMDGGADNG